MQEGIKEGIWDVPKCSAEHCNGKGFVYISGRLFCGECILKQKEKRDKIILEELGVV